MENLKVISCILFLIVVATGRAVQDDYGRLVKVLDYADEEGQKSRDDYMQDEEGWRGEDFDIPAEQLQDYIRTSIREEIAKYANHEEAKDGTVTLSEALNNRENDDDEDAKTVVEEMKIAPVVPAKNVEKKDVGVSMEKPENKRRDTEKKGGSTPVVKIVKKEAVVTPEKAVEKAVTKVAGDAKDVPATEAEEKKGVATPTTNEADDEDVAAPTTNEADDDEDVAVPTTNEADDDEDVAVPTTKEADDDDDDDAAITSEANDDDDVSAVTSEAGDDDDNDVADPVTYDQQNDEEQNPLADFDFFGEDTSNDKDRSYANLFQHD